MYEQRSLPSVVTSIFVKRAMIQIAGGVENNNQDIIDLILRKYPRGLKLRNNAHPN